MDRIVSISMTYVTPCLTKAQKTSRNADGNISAVSPQRDTYPLSFLLFLLLVLFLLNVYLSLFISEFLYDRRIGVSDDN